MIYHFTDWCDVSQHCKTIGTNVAASLNSTIMYCNTDLCYNGKSGNKENDENKDNDGKSDNDASLVIKISFFRNST